MPIVGLAVRQGPVKRQHPLNRIAIAASMEMLAFLAGGPRSMDEVFPEPPDDAPFWQRLKWHMQRGTRPPGKDSHRGPWTNTDLGGAVDRSQQAAGRWTTPRDERRTLPSMTNTLEKHIFGEKPEQDNVWYATQRRKFRLALSLAQAEAAGRKTLTTQSTRNERRSMSETLSSEGSSTADIASALSFESSGSVTNIAIRAPRHFLGREEILAQIWNALEVNKDSLLAPPTVALHGMRGVGKTSLAVAYAANHAGHYRVRWWVDAQTPEALRESLMGLGARLGWIGDDDRDDRAFELVRDHLCQGGDDILLLYDNAAGADAVRRFLPSGGRARSIITSNAHAWGDLAHPIEVHIWPKDIGSTYLLRRTGRGDEQRGDAESLSTALEGLPLAHEQASAYCETLNVSFDEYQRRFEASPLNLLDSSKYAPPDYHDRRTVAKTFQLAMDALQDRATPFYHPAAEKLLLHAALLGPFHIPISLFYRGRPKLRELMPDLAGDQDIDQATGALLALSLVKRESVPDDRNPQYAIDGIRLHRLVRLIAMERFPRSILFEVEHFQLTKAFPIAYPDAEMLRDPSTEQFARSLDAILVHLLGAKVIHSDDWDPFVEEMLTRAAYHSLRSSASDEAYRRLIYLVDWHREEAFFTNKDVTAIFHGYGRKLDAQELKIFEVEQQRHEELRNALHRHFRTQRGLSDNERTFLAATRLIDMHEFDAARGLLEGLLHRWCHLIRKGEINTDTGSSEEVSEEMSPRSDTPPTLDRLTAIHDMLVNSCRHLTARTIHEMALVFDHLAHPDAARPLYEQALAMREATQEGEHPDIAVTLTDLGIFLWRYNLPGARDALERADTLFRLRPDREPERFTACREHLARIAT